jgi:hypothetical protein
MTVQIIAIGAAIAYALSFILSKRGFRNSTPLNFVSLLIQSVTPLTATLPLWVVIGSKLFLNDVEKITRRIAVGALLVVLGTVAISLAKV